MNILLFVTSLLMILSLMTYARVDSFRYFLGLEAEFERYISTVERSYINSTALNWYINTHAPRQRVAVQKKEPPKKTKNQGASSSRLSFRIFIDPKMRQEKPDALKQTTEWAKRLMIALYGKQDFFIETIQKNPGFMDQILESLERATEDLLLGKIKLTEAAQLSNLHLDPNITLVFYHMLKGCQIESNRGSNKSENEKKNILETSSASTSDGDEEDETDDDSSNEFDKAGYDSLLNFITLRNAINVRVFLASKPLLTAIFGQPEIADTIIEARQTFYRAVVNGSLTADEATDQFERMLKGYLNSNDENFLDFRVSRTNPARYN